MYRMHIINRALGLLALAAILAMLLVACGDEEEPTAPAATGQPVAPPTVETMMEEATATPVPIQTATPRPTVTPRPTATPRPTPEPTPVVLGDCRDGMRLQPGEGCRYTGGGSPQANVVLSVQHDGAICREGGPAKQQILGATINMDHLRLCSSGGFERDDAFQSEIVASANADGSWTFYESRLSASRPRATTTPTPEPTATPTPEPTAAPTATPVRPGKYSEFNGAVAATWRRMHEGGEIVACYEGLALPRDSFCLSEGFRFTPDYSEILDTKFLVAHLPEGDALVLQGNTTSRSGGDIKLGWITFENRVITHLEFNASQTSTTATPTAISKPVTIPDPNLRREIERSLGKSSGTPVFSNEMETLLSFEVRYEQIGDLEGIQFATNLRRLELVEIRGSLVQGAQEHSPLDLSPLAALTNLTRLNLSQNKISDLLPLAGLTNLEYLSLEAVYIRRDESDTSTLDLSPLAGLTKLTDLALSYNNILDISPLASLTALERLNISKNHISDISPLVSLIKLVNLNGQENRIADVSPLSGLTALQEVVLPVNDISDISPLVANVGLGSGDVVDIRTNPLNAESIGTHIPAL